ncbi:GNAT family N-acetyltransferase [Amphritea pacifica]|uniref:bifunctional helix-turn-helix transcriptional regulator/GNAT family N-acetyltransferase n=1 Tax=Amphritea pacifica TaxID=2811233 RepID=UPI001964E570|nr:bifunctional helix-turn-helix transcriptional regulator/GNAT family N-acetyltransferase [Amphritea pacifica]MBN1005683.1 bifunctional helix-turn-helix transcriptional regulator/GNAT family N-acetyltransferase [Amphritea pacifica]
MDYMKSFGSLSLGSRLKRLSDRLVQDVIRLYQSQGIELNPTFFPLFNMLHQQGAMTVTDAAERLGVTHPAISKIARKMQQEEWLSKTADPEDERRQLLALSSKSEQLLEQITPVWAAIQGQLDTLISCQQHPLLDSLAEFENLLQQRGFYTPVVEQLARRNEGQDIVIQGWDAELRDDFRRLNLAWLNRYFDGHLLERDREALNNPEGYYLAQGGYIWFARHQADNQVVGCVALARHDNERYEISKMGVDDSWQTIGVGRRLLMTALDKARELGASEVFLESSSKLERALQLYRNLGFREIPHPEGQSYYDRADIYMTLTLRA